MTYWVPMADRELSSVSSYIKWEQAFRVYMNLYAKKHPERITKLLEYNHVIETASAAYPWDNVYKYDREFRIHMGEHPHRNWGIILQQAWALYIKSGQSNNPVLSGGGNSSNFKSSSAQSPGGFKKICYPYNAGECTFGLQCRFDHCCGVCGKRGHGAFNCRKLSGKRSPREHEDKWHKKDRRGNGNKQGSDKHTHSST